MKSFLHHLAHTLYDRHGDAISKLDIVFPSRRARLFFVEELRAIAASTGRPLWQPRFTTIDELFAAHSTLRIADRTRLIVELYRVYSQFHDESFDKFYSWGELLLSDFDTVDKYLVNADMLFRNLLDLKELEADMSYLTPEQITLIKQFWQNFGDGASPEKRRFLKLWQTLAPIYHAYRARLREQGLAYAGMLHRDAVSRLEGAKPYIIAGFNALTECEKKLFNHLAHHGAEFVWDYDDYYVDNPHQEAGRFLRENIPALRPSVELPHSNFLNDKQITVTSTPSNAVQCKHVHTLLEQLRATQGTLGKDTAIVLTDESLLLPLLHALPDDLPFNVTMGYPLRQSHAYALWERGEDSENRYLEEEVEKLRNTLDECGVAYSASTFTLIARRHLQSLRIPYEGEPLEGVQVMGILETRNIDFRNVILLSCGDDTFPGKHSATSSFVPYNLRAAYRLPTPEYHEGTQAYLFYRLLQRAENVHLLYCSHADEKTTGEPSRYLYQLEYESGLPIRRHTVGIDIAPLDATPIEVAKAGLTLPTTLSPTVLCRYIACPLRFYFYSVTGLRPPTPEPDEVDAQTFGKILHAALQYLPAQASTPGEIEPAVIFAINTTLHTSVEEYTGNLLLIKEIITHYVGNVAKYDRDHPEFETLYVEKEVAYDFPPVRFSGVVDRIDKWGEMLRVVDYKTGGGEKKLEFKSIDTLFHGKASDQRPHILQTLLYAMMLGHSGDCVPGLYYVRDMYKSDYSPLLVDKERNATGLPYSAYREEFEALLRETLAELFNTSIPFRQCEDTDTCKYCDFKTLCKR